MSDGMALEAQGIPKALRGQRIIILGACCVFGRSLARALNTSGAQVVAADTNTEGLAQISGALPLRLKGAPGDAMRRVGVSWGEARLDAVLNLMPLRHPGALDINIDVLKALAEGFSPALCRWEGQILTVAVRPRQATDLGAGAMVPALLSAQAAFTDTLPNDAPLLNLITQGEGALLPARAAVLGMLARALGPLNGTHLRL
jgi:NAD(P)-dependent dehydrogenase (short-subunit alcohol dehydrogenase family)